jgi:iron(III) transport system ATP-binding protein
MLSVTDLRKTFPGHSKAARVNAVDGVSFEVKEGEFFTLLGPSGCGKTTTLRAIAGLERADGGSISIAGRVVHAPASKVFVPPNHRGIGMVFQSYAIWPHMTVFENVAFPLRVQKLGLSREALRTRVLDTLRVVQLDTIAMRSATTLSGGQQQRLALARALVFEPVLMLLDEPLSNLDAKLRESMRFELKRLQKERNLTTIYVTHDQAEALALSTRIAVMSHGRIEQLGTPDEVYSRPATAFVADFIGSANLLPGTVATVGPTTTEIDTAEGVLVAGTARAVAVGQPCVVAIRPEHVEVLDEEPADQPNIRFGEVLAGVYTGQAVDYEVRVGRKTLRCRTPATRQLDYGRRVWLRLPAEHCLALPSTAERDPELLAS